MGKRPRVARGREVDERTRAIAARVRLEARARSGPDATFEQRREAAAQVMSEVLGELRAEEEGRVAPSSKEKGK